jgi:hypothetical protein
MEASLKTVYNPTHSALQRYEHLMGGRKFQVKLFHYIHQIVASGFCKKNSKLCTDSLLETFLCGPKRSTIFI